MLALTVKIKTDKTWLIWAVMAGGLVLRVLLVFMFPDGHKTDAGTFFAWMQNLNDYGISHFYANTSFCDYPPGYLYILAGLGKIINALGLSWGQPETVLVMRAPAIICDLAAIYIIGRYAAIEKADFMRVCIFYAVCPPVLINASMWGQVDSVWTLPLLCALIFLHRKKAIACAIAYAVALLIKPQAMLFAPVFLIGFIGADWWKNYIKAAVTGIIVFMAGIFPFVQFNFSEISNKYFGTMSSYPYATVNAFNFYAMIGANWAKLSNRFLFVNYQFWGYAVIAAAVLYAAYFYFKKCKNVFCASYILMVSLFMFATMMHERYLYPVFALMLMTYIYTKNIRLLYCTAALACVNFLNVYLVLIAQAGDEVKQTAPEAVFIVSVLTLICGIAAIWASNTLIQKKQSS